MEPLHLKAYAKINLTLEVLGRRPDGYHNITTLLQTIALWDDLLLFPAEDGISVECSEPALQGPSNLVYRAVALLQEAAGICRGVRIVVRKAIPVAGGLGGGSADAGAVLRGLVRLWGLSLPMERLVALGERLGADVPFFLWGGTALAEGRGEKITPLPPLPETWFVLLAPPLGSEGKTARLFRLLEPRHFTDGSRTRALADSLRQGFPLSDALLFNAFEAVAWDAFPGLEAYWRGLEECACAPPHLSGAGPSLFALASSPHKAQECAQRLRARGWRAWAVPSVGPEGGE
ncbi:4-diphosphocytidyl-2-C-methyl-D-erythritol kinase [bacterium HR23]|nr:4-diphosphocytidyl-2-C-methyl-D-erythritol kinase [bacterium HR23]